MPLVLTPKVALAFWQKLMPLVGVTDAVSVVDAAWVIVRELEVAFCPVLELTTQVMTSPKLKVPQLRTSTWGGGPLTPVTAEPFFFQEYVNVPVPPITTALNDTFEDGHTEVFPLMETVIVYSGLSPAFAEGSANNKKTAGTRRY